MGYKYAILDRNGTELLAFHWHPDPSADVSTYPHLHVSASLRLPRAGGTSDALPLDKIHVPTGVVTLAAVVRMLIVELGVEPIAADWAARLDRGDAVLRASAEGHAATLEGTG